MIDNQIIPLSVIRPRTTRRSSTASCAAGEQEATWLGVEPDSPALVVQRVGFSENDKTVRASETITKPDKARLFRGARSKSLRRSRRMRDQQHNTENTCADQSGERNRHERQKTEVDAGEIGLVRRAFAHAKEAPQNNAYHADEFHDFLQFAQSRKAIFDLPEGQETQQLRTI